MQHRQTERHFMGQRMLYRTRTYSADALPGSGEEASLHRKNSGYLTVIENRDAFALRKYRLSFTKGRLHKKLTFVISPDKYT